MGLEYSRGSTIDDAVHSSEERLLSMRTRDRDPAAERAMHAAFRDSWTRATAALLRDAAEALGASSKRDAMAIKSAMEGQATRTAASVERMAPSVFAFDSVGAPLRRVVACLYDVVAASHAYAADKAQKGLAPGQEEDPGTQQMRGALVDAMATAKGQAAQLAALLQKAKSDRWRVSASDFDARWSAHVDLTAKFAACRFGEDPGDRGPSRAAYEALFASAAALAEDVYSALNR